MDTMYNQTNGTSEQIYVIDGIGDEIKGQNHVWVSNSQRQISKDDRRRFPIMFHNITKLTNFNGYEFKIPVGLLGVAIIIGMSLQTLILTCWPQHNVILRPEYWYEPIAFSAIAMFSFSAALFIQMRLLFCAEEIMPLKSFPLLYAIRLMGSITILLSIHQLWVGFFNLPHPMPQTGTLHLILNSFVVAPLSYLLIFTSKMKEKIGSFRKNLVIFIVLSWMRILMGTVYVSVPRLPIVKGEYLQLSLGIILPLMKKFNLWWNSKFAFNCDKETSQIENIISVNCQHSFALTIVLGSAQINRMTAFLLVVVDTLMNGWSVRSIIKLHHQGTEAANAQKDKSLKHLVLKEFLEILIPAVYCISFTGSYLGPNYDIIGGIGSDLWHHEKTYDLFEKLGKILMFMSLESFRGIAFGLFLWKFFRLNMYTGYCFIIQKYGWLILFIGALNNQSVSIIMGILSDIFIKLMSPDIRVNNFYYF